MLLYNSWKLTVIVLCSVSVVLFLFYKIGQWKQQIIFYQRYFWYLHIKNWQIFQSKKDMYVWHRKNAIIKSGWKGHTCSFSQTNCSKANILFLNPLLKDFNVFNLSVFFAIHRLWKFNERDKNKEFDRGKKNTATLHLLLSNK